MCTVTSHLSPERLLVTMSRDERRERPAERPPVVHPATGDAPAWVAPADELSGGTWMGANAFGLVACVLNRYLPGVPRSACPTVSSAGAARLGEPAVARGSRPSRGSIIPQLLTRGDHDAARSWLERELDPTPFASFTLIVCSPVARELYTWPTEGGLEHRPWGSGWTEFSSSSWNTDAVLAWRRERFAEWVAAGAEHAGPLPTYHLFQPEGMAAWAPLMSRSYAATRSITQVAVDPAAGELLMRYWPNPTPQAAAAAPATELALPLLSA
jgi:hypothetical protein